MTTQGRYNVNCRPIDFSSISINAIFFFYTNVKNRIFSCDK